jgi:hypothetical protein
MQGVERDMRKLLAAGLVLALALPSSVLAGSAGNPSGMVGKERFGLTFEVEHQAKKLDQDPTRSRRYLGKVIWGASDRVDLYAKLGASHLIVDAPGAPGFRGDDRMTWGGGARVGLAEIESPNLFIYGDVQAISYSSKADILVARFEGDDSWIDRQHTKYKWNEIVISFIAAWDRPVFRPYTGFNITNVWGFVERDIYRVYEDIEEPAGHSRSEYREDAIPELILGVDLGIGGSGNVSGEIRFSEGGEVSYFIGVSEMLM